MSIPNIPKEYQAVAKAIQDVAWNSGHRLFVIIAVLEEKTFRLGILGPEGMTPAEVENLTAQVATAAMIETADSARPPRPYKEGAGH